MPGVKAHLYGGYLQFDEGERILNMRTSATWALNTCNLSPEAQAGPGEESTERWTYGRGRWVVSVLVDISRGGCLAAALFCHRYGQYIGG